MIDNFSGKHAFLSNFFPGDNSSLEHKFQAAKTNNPIEQAEVMACSTPGQAKRLGRKVEMKEDWNEIRVPTMIKLVHEKFQLSPLKEKLLVTDDKVLIEGNRWHDNFWGDCRCGRDACSDEGKNTLGKILMLVREILRR